MVLSKLALAAIPVSLAGIYSVFSLLLCHESGAPTPGNEQTTTTSGAGWQQLISEATSGYLRVQMGTTENTSRGVAESNGATERLVHNGIAPLSECCHGVEFTGNSTLTTDVRIYYPSENDTSYAQIGDANNRAFTRWQATTDNCGGSWSDQLTVDVWERLQYTSGGVGLPPVRNFEGYWRRYRGDNPPPGPGNLIADNGTPQNGFAVQWSETCSYLANAQYKAAATLAVTNEVRPTIPVRTDAPLEADPLPELSLADFTADVTTHRVQDTVTDCNPTSLPAP